MTTKLVTAAAVVAVAGSAPAQLIIDDFSTSQSVLGGGVTTANGPGIYGGDRDVFASNADFQAAGGTAMITNVTVDDQEQSIEYDGMNGQFGRMRDLPSTNLLALGDRFAFDVLSLTGEVDLRTVIIVSGDVSETGRSFVPTRLTISSTGTFEIPLTAFTGNAVLTDIRSISFPLRLDSGESIEIDNIRYVPTPTAAGILGFAGLAATRRRR